MSSVTVNMGEAVFEAAQVPVVTTYETLIGMPTEVAGGTWEVTCLSVGNPHCVVFCESIDGLELERLGPRFEHDPIFPERVNAEFVRVVNRTNLRMRVWERGIGETLACGTGACAAVAAAIKDGYCDSGTDVHVSVPGGELIVNCTDSQILLTGSATQVFEGVFEY